MVNMTQQKCRMGYIGYLSLWMYLLFVKVDSVVMLSTSVSSASRMLSVLTDTSMTMTDMATQLPGLAGLFVRLV